MVFHKLELKELYHQRRILRQLANFCMLTIGNPFQLQPYSDVMLLFSFDLLLLLC